MNHTLYVCFKVCIIKEPDSLRHGDWCMDIDYSYKTTEGIMKIKKLLKEVVISIDKTLEGKEIGVYLLNIIELFD